MLNTRIKRGFLIGVLFLFLYSSNIFANNRIESASYKLLNTTDNYFSFGLSRTYVLGKSSRNYIVDAPNYRISYKYNWDYKWMIGFSSHFMSLKHIDNKNKHTLFTFGQDVYKMIRLYHPTYGLFGGRFFYLQPVTIKGFSFRKIENMSQEVGVSFSFGMTTKLTRNIMCSILIDRWRGIASQKYSGITANFELGMPL